MYMCIAIAAHRSYSERGIIWEDVYLYQMIFCAIIQTNKEILLCVADLIPFA